MLQQYKRSKTQKVLFGYRRGEENEWGGMDVCVFERKEGCCRFFLLVWSVWFGWNVLLPKRKWVLVFVQVETLTLTPTRKKNMNHFSRSSIQCSTEITTFDFVPLPDVAANSKMAQGKTMGDEHPFELELELV